MRQILGRLYRILLWPTLLTLLAGLSGCNTIISSFEAPSVSTPPPTPEALTVAITPDVRTFWGKLHACALFHPEIALLLWETPSSSPEFREADLSIRLGTPPVVSGDYMALLGETKIVVIVHPSNPLQSLTSNEIKTIFLQGSNSSGQPMQVWILQNGDVSQIFNTVVLEDGKITPQAHIAPDPAAMLAAVASDTTAIGYLPATWLNDKVRPLALDNTLSVELSLPILALSAAEPQGNPRIFLGCLQKDDS